MSLPAENKFCWIDFMVPSPASAKTFYQKVLGWTYTEVDIPGGTYPIIHTAGGEVGGMVSTSEMTGVPAHISTYISVQNVDDYAAKAMALGGKVILDPHDVMDYGRMAAIQDPTGATFSLWHAQNHKGSTAKPEDVGMFSWLELITPNSDASAKFYTSLFNWKTETEVIGGKPYTNFMQGETARGGMMQMDKMPSAWCVYFTVDNCDAVVTTASALGAQIVVPKREIPIGWFAGLIDPQGVYFSVYQAKAM